MQQILKILTETQFLLQQVDNLLGSTVQRALLRNRRDSFYSFGINIYIRAFLLPKLFPNSFSDVNTVCPRDPIGKPSGTRKRNRRISRGVPEAIE